MNELRLDLLSMELSTLGLALIVFMTDLLTKDGGSKRYLGWLTAVGCFSLVVYILAQPNGDAQLAFGGMFVADGLAKVFKIIFLMAAGLTALASMDYLDQKGVAWQGEYYFLLLMVTVAMMVMAAAGDLLTLYVALEMNTIGFYVLVAILKGRSPFSAEGGLKYLVLGALSSGILLYGISLFYGQTGTLALAGMSAYLTGKAITPLLAVATTMMIAGFAFKISLVPFHMWSPDVYQAAPTPITGLLSVASKAAGVAVILRVIMGAFLPLIGFWADLLALLAVLTYIVANFVALKQTDSKRLLAYSSISQAGYIVIGVIAGSKLGMHAVIYFMLVYLFTNIAAFQVISLISADNQDNGDLSGFDGLAQRSPVLALVMLASMLSLAGIPPMGGFFGKFFLFAAGVQAGWTGLVFIGIVMSIASLFYYLVVIKRMYIEPPHRSTPVASGFASRLVLGICALFTLAMGAYPQPFLDWLAAVVR